jgi:heptosyltransferase-2/heptosyltransferase-3
LLARDLRLHVVLSGMPKERRLLTSIARAVPSKRVFQASHDLPMRRLLALLERAAAMVSVDTGPAHAAAALGCPLIVLYGAARPAQWLPRGAESSTVIAIGGPPERRRVSEISLDEVLEALRSLPFRPSSFVPEDAPDNAGMQRRVQTLTVRRVAMLSTPDHQDDKGAR